MTVEVRRREEWCRRVLHQCLLLSLGLDPEHDDVLVPLARVGINGVGAGVSKEYEGLAAYLIDGVVTSAGVDSDVRQRDRQFVNVLDAGLPRSSCHDPTLTSTAAEAPLGLERLREATLSMSSVVNEVWNGFGLWRDA